MHWLLQSCQAHPRRRVKLREWGRALGRTLGDLAGLAALSLLILSWLATLVLIAPVE